MHSRRRAHHDFQDHRPYNKQPHEHMDTQAFAQAYGARKETSDHYHPPQHSRFPPEEPAYRPYSETYVPSQNSQVSNVWKTLECHKSFLKSDPVFEKQIHDQINAIAESRMQHEAQLTDLDDRLANYSAILGLPPLKSGLHSQAPPESRDLGAKRTPTGTMVFFKTRPLGFEVDFRTMTIKRVWRTDLAYLGITAGMTIESFNGYGPTKEVIEEVEPPFVIHFANPVRPKSVKSVSFEQVSPVEKLGAVENDEKTKEPTKAPEVITRTITTPDREEPPAPEISNVDAVPLHPKLNLENFSTRALGKLYGRAYGQYLEQQVLPWSTETDTEKERLKILMGRIRILLEKYSVVLEKEILRNGDIPNNNDKVQSPVKKETVSEIDRERERVDPVVKEDEKKATESENDTKDPKPCTKTDSPTLVLESTQGV